MKEQQSFLFVVFDHLSDSLGTTSTGRWVTPLTASLILSSAQGNNGSRLRVKERGEDSVEGVEARKEGKRKKTQNRKEKEPTQWSACPLVPCGASQGVADGVLGP